MITRLTQVITASLLPLSDVDSASVARVWCYRNLIITVITMVRHSGGVNYRQLAQYFGLYRTRSALFPTNIASGFSARITGLSE